MYEAPYLLSPRTTARLLLCELHEMSYVETAAALNCAVGTVRSRLHRARAMLVEKLGHKPTQSLRRVVPIQRGVCMNCQAFDNIVSDLARNGMVDAAISQDGLDHASECDKCFRSSVR